MHFLFDPLLLLRNIALVELQFLLMFYPSRSPLLCPFITTKTPFLTFKIPTSIIYLYSLESMALRELRFLFKSRPCLRSPSILRTPLNILISSNASNSPDALLPINKALLDIVSYIENLFDAYAMCN